MKIILITFTSLIGLFLVFRGFKKNIREIRTKEKDAHTLLDRFFNYPLMVIWYSYLIIFFIGLFVNNLIIK